jgi:hypothetical protein
MPEACGVFGRSRELGAVAAFLDGLPSGPSGLTDRGRSRDRQDDGVDGPGSRRRRALVPGLAGPSDRIGGEALVRGAW